MHQPHNFALQIIEGLAARSNNYSRYIPIYTTPYFESQLLFPTFLLTSNQTGYQVPKDIAQLLRLIQAEEEELPSDEEKARRHFFLNRMASVSIKLMEESHPDCAKDRCSKVSCCLVI